ncbi:electron transport complex subunit RsxC [Shewanella sp. UCD-KL12]|uniref:electron transport complex subunit RsxC n=1 Tax=Shewanella sp. UCD-KL12 TaxID=1917163 RepID=UPI00097121A2|nr:electron transport complex subunit RsxC [Shewanella sp. UCD-KL12]
MLTLFEQIDKGTLWRSIGGIHPPERKSLSNRQAIGRFPLAQEYVIPLTQVGESSVLVVKQGDYVAKGTVLTAGTHFAHLPVHAPTSGYISAIEARPSNHASGLDVLSCVITPDGLDTPCAEIHPKLSAEDVLQLTDKQILNKIQQAGIAGLGGAAFPTHIKLNPASDIELVIINAIECEPYITADDMLMRENSDELLNGIAIIHRLLKPKRLIIAIEDNKPEAIEIMQHALSRSSLPQAGVRITCLPTLYPSGGEKQLIQILTGQEVPSGAIPAQLGILVQNIATAYAINEAVLQGYPLIERVVTITGENTNKPGNYWLPIGTPISHLLTQADFSGNENDKVIIGGPMMGYALHNDNAPTLKGSNCVLLPANSELAPPQAEMPCVRCGECAQVCPAQLLPQQLFWHSKAQEYDKASSFNLADCIECGCCTYVCPSEIPLVEYYRIAKAAIKTETEEKKQAELAKQRFELRTQRLEDEKRAREEKQKEAAARRKSTMTSTDKDAVAMAMARIKAKKEASANSGAESSKPKGKEISAAVARAKAKKAAKASSEESEANSTVTDSERSSKVAAAVARAKAKKAAAKDGSSPADEAADKPKTNQANELGIDELDDKKAKIAAAVARAKAKKATAKDGLSPTDEATDKPETNQANELGSDELGDKKAKIAAAVARAKAKKAAAKDGLSPADEATDKPKTNQANELGSDELDDKKAKIAAAVAKAKAKKAAKKDGLSPTDETTDKPKTNQANELGSDELDDKKAKIAAAVAKAKAKKAASKDGSSTTDEATDKPQTDQADTLTINKIGTDKLDDKKAKIAAAVAKAKAKKAAVKDGSSATNEATDKPETNQADTLTINEVGTDELDDRKAKIAAAVAKAKARKASRSLTKTNENNKD